MKSYAENVALLRTYAEKLREGIDEGQLVNSRMYINLRNNQPVGLELVRREDAFLLRQTLGDCAVTLCKSAVDYDGAQLFDSVMRHVGLDKLNLDHVVVCARILVMFEGNQ